MMGTVVFLIVKILIPAFFLWLAVILVRAVMYKPKPELIPSEVQVTLDEAKIVADLQQMIRCRTVSYNDDSLIDEGEFEKFRQLLTRLYTKVHETCSLQFLGVNGILYHWKGKQDGDPVVLRAHYDVVPVEESQWEKPAFEGLLEDGCIWGRGTLDT